LTDALARLIASLADRYRIERELGAGGMATVYLAHDLKHDRPVAIKVLRPELAAVIGAERFLSEIKTTANLQHPHILPLFDSGVATVPAADSLTTHDSRLLFYVMPFVEGESLRDRLTRDKQLSITDAVRIATEVAGALDYAHRRGIVHRDIKPENILLHDGRALVADFGIALAVSTAGGPRLTETGMSLGTPAYMSPEQAMGEREITARSDVYALGVVTYEMLLGEPPFSGPTAQAIVAKVLTEKPAPLMARRDRISPAAEDAVLTALEKLPADRFATAHEFAEALQGGDSVRSARTGRAPAAAGWRTRLRDPVVLVSALVALASLAAAFHLARRTVAPAIPPIRFVMSANDSTQPVDNFPWPAAISPDGSKVVYSVAQAAATNILYLLNTDQLVAHPIPGTVGAAQPYFSPDGTWLAFEADDKERKVRLDGSAPLAIADGAGANGADWTTAGEIVLGAQGAFPGLSRVSASGGVPVALTRPDTTAGEQNHFWPIALPDGKTVVFAIWSGSLPGARLALVSMTDGKVVPLGIAGVRPLAVLDGMLVYLQADGGVMAVALDVRGKRTRGAPIPVHDPVQVASEFNGNSGIFVSNGGGLVTSRVGARGRIAWTSRDGRVELISPQMREFQFARLSPDERRIAVLVAEGAKRDVWIYDMALATFSRLTSVENVLFLEWSADGTRIVFTTADGDGGSSVWSQLASGGSQADRLFHQADPIVMATMAPDGKSLLVNTPVEDYWGLFRVALDSAPAARSYLIGRKTTLHAPQFSPDSKWVAFLSTESGRDEVYVRSFPDPSAKIQVSVAGGVEPAWSRDGRHLYYRSGSSLLEATMSLSPTLAVLARDTVLSNATALGSQVGYDRASYQPTRDDKRFLTIFRDGNDFELVISPNWITELRRRVAESSGQR